MTPDPNTTITTLYSYDTLDRLVQTSSERDPSHNVVIQYVYDESRNPTLIRLGEATNGGDPANTIRYFYDERDLPFRTTRGETSATPSTTQFDYDGNGDPKTIRMFDRSVLFKKDDGKWYSWGPWMSAAVEVSYTIERDEDGSVTVITPSTVTTYSASGMRIERND